MEDEKACGFCKHYYENIDNRGTGECKYNPPVAYNPIEDQYGFLFAKGVWPTTYTADWCSKFEEA